MRNAKLIQQRSEFLIKTGKLTNPVLQVHGNIGEEFIEIIKENPPEVEN